MKVEQSSLLKRIEDEIENYLTNKVEISPEVHFSQYQLIKRLYKFKNKDLNNGSKINPDLSYDFYFDIISPRCDSEVKNLRFDTKNIMVFSVNPRKDFAAVYISNTQLKTWMAENGEDDKLKAAVEEFTANGNVIFKKITGGYEKVDPLNMVITNIKAETIEDTAIIERHEMTASQIMRMDNWEDKEEVIKNCGNKFFQTTELTSENETTGKVYEIHEYTGEVSDKEFKELSGDMNGDENKYYLAKIIVAGLSKGNAGEKYTLFAEPLPKNKTMSDYYIDAHRGAYKGRFWREGMYEMLFDHQIRANEIGNQLATGLEWASKVFFQSSDSTILANIRADMENGEIITAKDLKQVDVRMQSLDQLIADWNRLNQDADKLANSFEVVRGESLPSGTAFRLGVLMDQNAGKLFVMLRQKISMPYKRVFKNWVLPELIKELKGEDIFRLVGDMEIVDQFREIAVESWYTNNLVAIGPHTREQAEALKQEKLDDLRNSDPTIENAKEIWDGVLPRMLVTITGENSDIQDQLQDLVNLVGLEQEPDRVAWILDTIYKSRNIPIPPRKEQEAPENIAAQPGQQTQQNPEVRAAQQPI